VTAQANGLFDTDAQGRPPYGASCLGAGPIRR
jgi:hypothetical protein